MTVFHAFLLVMISLVPVMMILFGYIFYKHPPKKVDSRLGYRTVRSTQNQDTWDFAHEFLGKTWLALGLLTLVLTVGGLLLNLNMNADALGNYAQVLLCIEILPFLGGILLTEFSLRRTFTQDGRRRNSGSRRKQGKSNRH